MALAGHHTDVIQRQHFLLSYLKTLSVGPAGVRIGDLQLSRPALSQLGQPGGGNNNNNNNNNNNSNNKFTRQLDSIYDSKLRSATKSYPVLVKSN